MGTFRDIRSSPTTHHKDSGVTVGGRLAVGDVRWLPGRGVPPATATGRPGAEWEHLAIVVILYSVLF